MGERVGQRAAAGELAKEIAREPVAGDEDVGLAAEAPSQCGPPRAAGAGRRQ
jgi:hypothetical protein